MDHTPTLLGPTARPLVALGGASAWRQRTIRGIVCSYQWLDLRAHGADDTPENANAACMCLFRPGSMGRGAYVVPQANAFHYGDNRGNPTPHLAKAAFLAAEQLGFDMRDKHAIQQVMTIILEGIPDLIDMPSEAPNHAETMVKRAVHGIEAVAKVNGKTVHSELL
jgi:hypothetical protein